MKPLGIYLVISGTHGEPSGLDDDYDWHVRQEAVALAAAASTRPTRLASLGERLRAMVRPLRSRAGEPTARRA